MTDFSVVRGIYGNMVMSGRWVKNATYPSNSTSNGDVTIGKMSAKAVLICRPNSHPFQDRTLILDQPVKIGRSVARARAATNNAIFDCKVLSRNHALLWYENGKFFLQDTKSSNGTFVNNQRLSKGAEESPPREVCSGDIVQFGVDVMENARKVTHGCIVATLKLFLPDGKEAKASPSTSVVNSLGAIPLEDLYQLSQYLQEALQREQVLENKLISLQSLLESTRDAADLSWKALIDEDRLLSRVEILESQLLVYSKNFQEDKLREELQKLLEDKDRYQGTAKESLKKIVDEKLEAIQKLQDLERMLDTTQTEYVNLHELCEKNQLNIQDLAQKYGQQLVKVEELYSQLQMAEEEHHEEIERLQLEKKELLEKLNEQNRGENEVLDVLNNDMQMDTPDIQSYTRTNQSNNENIDSNITKESIKSVNSIDTEFILDDTLSVDTSQIDLNQSTQEDVDKLQHLLTVSEHELKISEDEIHQVRTQLDDAKHQASFFCDRVIKLEDRIYDLETQLKLAEHQLEEKFQEDSSERECEEKSSHDIEVLKGEISSLEELLEEARAKVQYYEQEVSRYQQECEHATIRMKKATDESYLLKEQLESAKEELHQKGSSLKMIQEKSRSYQSTAENAVRLLTHLKDSLKNEEQSRNLLQEMENLRQINTELQQNAKQSRNEAEQAKSRFEAALLEAETKYSQLVDEYQAVKVEWSTKFKELENKIEQQSKRNANLRDHTPEYESLKLKEVESGGGDSYKSEERNEEQQQIAQSHQNVIHTIGTSEIEKISSLEEDLAMYKQSFSQLMEQNAYLHRTTTSLQEELDKRSRNVDIVFAGFIVLVAMCVGFVPYYFFESFGFL